MNAKIATAITIIAYKIIPNFQSPTAIFAPAKVYDITDGNLANVDISMNLDGFIGNNPAIYTNRSLGVPGNKNSINIIISIFLGFWKSLLFSIFFTLSSSLNSYTNFFPNFLNRKKFAVEIIPAEAIMNTVPHNPP